MANDRQTYNQPPKRKARATVLNHAVKSLTETRDSSPLVALDQFDRLVSYCVQQFRNHAEIDLREPMAMVQAHWNTVHASRVGSRLPSDLKVLFLCGPEPLNDLNELLALGIAPENVWAVEGDKKAYRAAAEQLRSDGKAIKLHRGSLQDFFTVVPEQFDIVYFDACGPLLGGDPETGIVLRELFLRQRMAPLSVLITNFAAKPRDTEEVWVKRLYSWYAPRYFQPVYGDIDGAMAIERIHDSREFCEHIRDNLERYYSDFVTRFTIEFVNELLPWWRVRALPSAKQAYFADDKPLSEAIEAALGNIDGTTAGGLLSPSSYPFLWTVSRASKELAQKDPLLRLLTSDSIFKVRLCDGINSITLIRNFYESMAGWTKHNRDACSDELREVLERFRWFDSEGMRFHRLFCDTPLPNLAVDLLVGVYGYPYHVNLEKLKRIEYTAKQTPMYTDVFVLDQCRYMYDLVPTLSMFGDHLPVDRQLQIRICMNLIRRHTQESCWHLFHGSALAGAEDKGFRYHSWPERRVIR